ncbi:hypothetical protein GQ600_11886 [Phytophthora cactorum]|nr:hypothetical protein GQ600_11886 [Phytophthora cactorum]
MNAALQCRSSLDVLRMQENGDGVGVAREESFVFAELPREFPDPLDVLAVGVHLLVEYFVKSIPWNGVV